MGLTIYWTDFSEKELQNIYSYYQEKASIQVATEITESAFLVGAHHDLTEEQISFLCSSLKDASSI